MKTAFYAASVFLIAGCWIWAVPYERAAHIASPVGNAEQKSWAPQAFGQQSRRGVERASMPGTVRFREVQGRGLLVSTWINGAGSFDFAIDTGVGTTLISERVAGLANVRKGTGASVQIGGLSGIGRASGRETTLEQVALGGVENTLPSRITAIVTSDLPPGVDGILDPTDAFTPLGYTLDLPREELSAFDPKAEPIRRGAAPPDGTVVPWLFDGQSRRPYVMLDNGRRALIDTGSAFGFAISEQAAHATGLQSIEASDRRPVQDIGGSYIGSRRVSPATINIGSLMLRGVPTDILIGVESTSPILLGRDALRPFRLAFDPVHRLIMIAPSGS
jgi:predicted aspartyl protease